MAYQSHYLKVVELIQLLWSRIPPLMSPTAFFFLLLTIHCATYVLNDVFKGLPQFLRLHGNTVPFMGRECKSFLICSCTFNRHSVQDSTANQLLTDLILFSPSPSMLYWSHNSRIASDHLLGYPSTLV